MGMRVKFEEIGFFNTYIYKESPILSQLMISEMPNLIELDGSEIND